MVKGSIITNMMLVMLLRASSELGDWGVFETPAAQCLCEQTAKYAIRPFAGEAASLQASAGFEYEAAYDSDVLERRRELLSERHDTVGAYKIVTRAYAIR